MTPIVEAIGAVIEAMRPASAGKYGQPFVDYITAQGWTNNIALMPHYLYGRTLTISNVLTEMEKDSTRKYKKYPLIALRLDTPETIVDGLREFNLNLAFLTLTSRNYTDEQRMANVVKPVLYPLYEEFMTQFGNVGLFMWPGNQDKPPHTKIDKLYWGTTGANGNEANTFPDVLDAVEVLDLKFRMDDC